MTGGKLGMLLCGALRAIALSALLCACTGGNAHESEAGAGDGGAAGALPGACQAPELLSGYPERPRWKVAGVDYAVGLPLGTVLRDPASISVAGVQAEISHHVVHIRTSNVTLSGYDFGLDGGWTISIEDGSGNVTIEKSNFRIGANDQVPINADAGAGSLIIQYNSFDGGRRPTDAAWSVINYRGSDWFVAQYNSFVDVPEDAIDFNGGTIRAIVQYNYFCNLGTAAGSHPDPVQFVGNTVNGFLEQFNTIYQPRGTNAVKGMQGVQVQAQRQSTIRNATIRNNVIVAPGPTLTMSYAIAVIEDANSKIDGVVIADNFIDWRGAFGPFYPPSGKNVTFIGNIDMRTGEILMPNSHVGQTDSLH